MLIHICSVCCRHVTVFFNSKAIKTVLSKRMTNASSHNDRRKINLLMLFFEFSLSKRYYIHVYIFVPPIRTYLSCMFS